MNAAERAYAHVKERILTGDLDGELVSEGAFSEELGVSRTPVREAFLRLEAEGLMRLYPRRGALVVPVAANEAREVFEARLLLEGHAIEQAAAAGPSLVTRLRTVIAEQRAGSDLAEFGHLDATFHAAIVDAGANALLSGFYAALRDRQRRMVAQVVRGSVPYDTLIGQHADIVDALEAGDAERARSLLTHHLRMASEAIL